MNIELRDYFAAKAMQGFITALGNPTGVVPVDDGRVAERAYEVADAMLAAREPKCAAEKFEFDDGWIEWKGGECPVAAHTHVEVKFQDGEFNAAMPACAWTWKHFPDGYNIIAYRIVQEGEVK